jgi:hypothetical protein
MSDRFEKTPLPEPDEAGFILAATIPGPLPPVPEYLIRRKKSAETDEPREITAFEKAVRNGDDGLLGVDGSGNEWDFPQQLGSTAVEVEFES